MTCFRKPQKNGMRLGLRSHQLRRVVTTQDFDHTSGLKPCPLLHLNMAHISGR